MTTATKDRARFAIDTASLRAALAAVSQAVQARTAKPILQNVLIRDGMLTGSDLEVRVDAELAGYDGPAVLLPHARLQAILREARDEHVTLEPKGTSVVVKCGRGTWTLPTEDAAEYPTWEPEGLKPVARFAPDQFRRAVHAVVDATDGESSRYALGSVLIDVTDGVVTFVATDGRRMSTAEIETDQAVDDGQTLVPERAMIITEKVFTSAGPVQVEANGNEAVFTHDGLTLTARLMQGRFPRWRDVIPERDAAETVVIRDELLTATRAAAIVTSEQSKGVDYQFTAKGIRLHGKSSEAGESTVTCEVETAGAECKVKLDPKFVAQWLSGVPRESDPTVRVSAVDHTSAVVLRCDSYLGVVMPLANE